MSSSDDPFSDVPFGYPKKPLEQRLKDGDEYLENLESKQIESAKKPTPLKHLNEIENPKHIGHPIQITAVISSNSIAYSTPEILEITEIEKDQYGSEQNFSNSTASFEKTNQINLALIAVSREKQITQIKNYFKPKKVIIGNIIKYRVIYRLRVRPPVFTLEKQDDKLLDEQGYEFKHLDLYLTSDKPLTFKPSTLIRLTGIPLPNPTTQKITLLAYNVEFLEEFIGYDIEKLKALKDIFEGKTVDERLQWILKNFESYSHIWGRQNIAKATLLSFFSNLHLNYDGDKQRGWLITAIIGDTTTGKSQTVKKFSKLLNAGSIISAETASTVGLTGTATQLEHEGWFVDWGFLPLMDQKLLGVDGAHKLNASCWAALAEAERSGVLSIAKAAKNMANARTRQIRIYNAVDLEADKFSTKSLSNFLYSIQALITVLDKTSIARLDLAVFSDQRDVDPEIINKKVTEQHSPLLENMAEVLKWAWSNKVRIVWADEAVDILLTKSTNFYKKFYYEAIPLVSIDLKNKIARLATALAFATLSTDENFTTVYIEKNHVELIFDFLSEEYTRVGLGILAQEENYEKLKPQDVEDLIFSIKQQLKTPVENLTEILAFIVKKNRITKDELKIKFSLTENGQARPLTAILKTAGLISSKNGYYSTSKLIEAYQVTDGFTVFNTLNTLNTVKKEPPVDEKTRNNLHEKKKRTINVKKEDNKQQLDREKNTVGEFYSEGVNPVKGVKNQGMDFDFGKSVSGEINGSVDFLLRDIPTGEKCELCGNYAVTKQILQCKTGEVFRRCTRCFKNMCKQFAGAKWRYEEA